MTDYPRVSSALEIRTSLTADQGNHTLAGRCGYSDEHQDKHPHIRTMTDVVPLSWWLFSALIHTNAHRLTAGRLVAPVRAVQVTVALPHRRDAPAVPTLELRMLTFYLGSCEAERGGVNGLLHFPQYWVLYINVPHRSVWYWLRFLGFSQ